MMATPTSPLRFLLSWLACCVGLLLALLPTQASADTAVSGAIVQNTAWSASQSPYLLLVDTVIDNGATLTIEAGTTVRVSPGASLIVKRGALVAAGSQAAPIVVTSSAEAGGTAAPGDWG